MAFVAILFACSIISIQNQGFDGGPCLAENKKDVDQKDGVEETAVEPSTDHLEGKIQKKKRKAVDDNTVHSRVSAPEATPQDTKKLKPSKLE
jgi:hypothetical protein